MKEKNRYDQKNRLVSIDSNRHKRCLGCAKFTVAGSFSLAADGIKRYLDGFAPE
jgi:hypothetical protein